MCLHVSVSENEMFAPASCTIAQCITGTASYTGKQDCLPVHNPAVHAAAKVLSTPTISHNTASTCYSI